MKSKQPLSKAQYESLAAFRYALRQFLHFSEAAAKAAGLTPQHHQALLAIKGFPGRDRIAIGELAERLQLKHHSAVGLVDRLEAERLAARVVAQSDRRKVMVRLTPRGEKLLARLSSAHHQQIRRIGPEITRHLGTLAGEAEN